MLHITSAEDLARVIRDWRPDLGPAGVNVTADEARDAMHRLGLLRYEALTGHDLLAIIDEILRASGLSNA